MSDTILELDSKMPFGKYKSWTVKEVLTDDPDYLRWAIANVADVQFECTIEDALDNESLRQELIHEGY